LIRGLRILGNQAFPAFLLRARVQGARIPLDLLAQSKRLREYAAHARLETLPAFGQRQPANILVPVPEDIEEDQRRWLTRIEALHIARSFEVNAPLQALKPGRMAVLVERDDLAVDEQRSVERIRQGRQGFDNRRKLAGLVVAEPRPHLDTPWFHVNQAPDAVIFGLVYETRLGQGRIGQSGQHGSDVRGVLAPLHWRQFTGDQEIKRN